MNAKKVVSVVLSAFVAASVVYLMIGSNGRGPAESPKAPPVSDARPVEAGNGSVTAFYFHGTARCRTCLAIENTAREVLKSELADDFERGAIGWRTVNFEEPENEHFAREFELTGATLVLVEQAAGTTVRYDKLERVWELIGDEASFRTYVVDHAREYLNGT